jgi:hypothetical protein
MAYLFNIWPIVIRWPSNVRTLNSRMFHGLSSIADNTSAPLALSCR